jgi:transcription-repair coupling factor (superfamily II helicase)
VHNRIRTIDRVVSKIKELAPLARVGQGHGQMNSKELEDVMKRFIHHEIDILVSTTIIESGIDIPNANTLFVDRADTFGLSELYQLKGRVGRFDREAFAYLLLSKNASLTHESQRRLNALVKHQHLGAGFNIAMEDLEIRGAGNVLGTEQSGFITAVGFDLYCRLLKDAIQSLKVTKVTRDRP